MTTDLYWRWSDGNVRYDTALDAMRHAGRGRQLSRCDSAGVLWTSVALADAAAELATRLVEAALRESGEVGEPLDLIQVRRAWTQGQATEDQLRQARSRVAALPPTEALALAEQALTSADPLDLCARLLALGGQATCPRLALWYDGAVRREAAVRACARAVA